MFDYSNRSKYVKIANANKGKRSNSSGKTRVIKALRKAGYKPIDTSIGNIHRVEIEWGGTVSEIEFDRNQPCRWYAQLRW